MNILIIAFQFQQNFFSVALKNIHVNRWKIGNWSRNVCVCGRRGTGFVFSLYFRLAIRSHYTLTRCSAAEKKRRKEERKKRVDI
jgi:hypothetical protein